MNHGEADEHAGPRVGGPDVGAAWGRTLGLVVFALALAVRVLYLYESSDSPVFETPIVDAATYDGLAKTLAESGSLTDGFFWQPFFYPLFLSLVYAAGGTSMIWAKIIQVAIGSLTCAMVYHLGRTLFGGRTGLLAGLIAAFYGPLIFFDAKLLGTGWSCFWSVALVLLFLRVAAAKSLGGCLFLGLCGGLSVLSRPTFLPFFGVTSVWLLYTFLRHRTSLRRVAISSALLVAGFLVVTLPVSKLSAGITGRFSFLPGSGGLNLYIGNNADAARTVAIRPGWAWDQLTRLPLHYGVMRKRDTSGFFREQAVRYARSEPWTWINGLGTKTLQFASSRELPRNVDIYLHRKWSWILSGLVWKAGIFGFPFGVLLPLTVVGLCYHWRQVPLPLKLFLALYSLSIILVFVTARYRMPVIPIMAVLAAAGCSAIIELARRRRWSILAGVGSCAVILAVLASLPGPFAQEMTDYEAEMYYVLGSQARERERLDEAQRLLSRALQLRPSYGDAHNALGRTLQEQGKLELAMQHYTEAVQSNPGHGTAHVNLGRGFAKQGRLDRAVKHLREAIRIDPFNAGVHTSLAIALSRQKSLEEAAHHFAKALELAPNDADKHNNMGGVLREQGKAEEAIGYFEHALRIEPTHLPALDNLVAALKGLGKREEAVVALQAALKHARAAADAERIAHIERSLEEAE